MNISGIGSYSGSYHSIKLDRLSGQQAFEIVSVRQAQKVSGGDFALQRQE